MEPTASTPKTLFEMREAKGLTAAEVGEMLGKALGRRAYSHSRILQIEKHGCDSLRITDALATIYGLSKTKVREASIPSQK